jgi:TM2 domain-containing membrane protein YozV
MGVDPQDYGRWPGSDQAASPPEAAQSVPAPTAGPDGYGYGYGYDQVQGQGQDQVRYQPQPQAQALVPAQPTWMPQAQPYPMAVAPKNGGIGVLLSFFIPGLGSLVNGSVGMGLIILGASVLSSLLCLILIGFPMLFGVWVWGMIDGYMSAERWNRAHGIIG